MNQYTPLAKPIARSSFLLSLAAPALFARPTHKDGLLSADEVAEIVDLLHRSRSDTLTKLAGLSDRQWGFKPGPDRWSAGQAAEHLYLAETGFHMRIDSLMNAKPKADWEKLSQGKVQVLTQAIPDRTNRVQAPSELAPKGRMGRAEIIEAYSTARSKMIERTRDQSQAYKAHIEESGTPLGALSAAHWLRFAALHNDRHNKQITEVLTDTKFPS